MVVHVNYMKVPCDHDMQQNNMYVSMCAEGFKLLNRSQLLHTNNLHEWWHLH